MPGLVGFTDKRCKYGCGMLYNMRSLLKHFAWYIDEDLYCDNSICSSMTHLGVLHQGRQPHVRMGRFLSWLEGEFYNQDELKSKYGLVSETDNELLLKAFRSEESHKFFRDVDGYFASVVYDRQARQISLISDRYGLKPLYWGIIDGDFVWSSELKGFLGHKSFVPQISQRAVKDFLFIGHHLENRTWFKGVQLVPPASVITFDIGASVLKIQPYWSWSEIKIMDEPIDEVEILEELERLFLLSVQKRVNPNERIGINLSGGLDSRAILAAVPEYYSPLYAFTFGQKHCSDVRIARKVAKLKGASHHIFELNSRNWLHRGIKGVWKSDGSLTLSAMHGIAHIDRFKELVDFNLSGFLGDAILGGYYITNNQSMEGRIKNRGRRFINQAVAMAESWLIYRRPFFDKDLTEFIFSIPESLRKNSYIYKKMLLRAFPRYYKNIPWQKTRIPINYTGSRKRLIEFKNRVTDKLGREAERFGWYIPNLNSFVDYPAWIRLEPAKSIFAEYLLSDDAMYQEYIDKTEIHRRLHNHMARRCNHATQLCLALTFELWLQQISGKMNIQL